MGNTLDKSMIHGHDVIVFDGDCVLCSGFFAFMHSRDRMAKFRYVVAQSPLGQAIYAQLGLPTHDFETNLVVVDGRVYQRLDAFAAAMRALPGLWPLLSMCRFFPGPVKDALYFLIARNRYRLFGRRQTCLVPDDQVRSLFLPEGF